MIIKKIYLKTERWKNIMKINKKYYYDKILMRRKEITTNIVIEVFLIIK